MNEKKNSKITLSTLFLIISVIVIIVMAYFMFKLYNEKAYESEKVANLNEPANNLENTIDNLQEKNNSTSINTENPISTESRFMLDGRYGFEGGADIIYEFDKNGNALISGNVSEEKGTYSINEDDEIEIILTEKIDYDIYTGAISSSSINRVEKIQYINENTLLFDNEKLIKLSNN